MSEVIIGGNDMLHDPHTGDIIDTTTHFCDVFGLVNDMVPFDHRPYESWACAAEIRRVFNEYVPPTKRTLSAKHLFKRFEQNKPDGRAWENWYCSVNGELYLYGGTWPSHEIEKRTEYVNPNYCHESAKPRPEPPDHADWIETHASIGSPPGWVATHLGIDIDTVDDHCFEAFGESYLRLAEFDRRYNTIALSLDWGSDPSDIAYVFDTDVETVEKMASKSDVPSDVPDPSTYDRFHVR